jgi:hypothetical protein
MLLSTSLYANSEFGYEMKNDFVTGHLNRMFSQREEESPSSQGPS